MRFFINFHDKKPIFNCLIYNINLFGINSCITLIPITNFGSSDCKCKSHLFKIKERGSMKFFKVLKKLGFKIVTKPDRYH